MSTKKRLPIGNDDFSEIRKNNYYYIDKSLMIKEFIEMEDKVALIARPRRFGKSLNCHLLHQLYGCQGECIPHAVSWNVYHTAGDLQGHK